ncbi:penicillin-binding protein 2 [Borrelia miyamotoi]|uniref:Penicillin-binding protein 2 n=1 Tax=Borrelia miyamotoi TaxID=47466 RepID=A0AAQ3AGN2_9SPIR|nr:penicillin-binding protein 2 [Borrelia miyamotoi]AGT27662.1 penicillin-binding protein [Borrelia miyamotoi LB-2001]AJA58823.1 penicillin-binding protein [Borrelia miyamotoi]AOW95907.1 penicillin-binding protein 2 [Borrelia miyamotoi]QTL83798.1 penicillin-binding protein 2 [Borrelia miyamotoi]WAZ84896.1 penicillin-binding protein 2 [Borrelia miyamotoi]
MKVILKSRYRFGLLLLSFVFFYYLFTLFKMQIGKHLLYDKEATVLLSRVDKIKASRGEILDSNFNVLANNLTIFVLKISLEQYYGMSLEDREEMLNFLSSILGIEKELIISKIEAPRGYLKDVEIVELSPEMLFRVAEKRSYYPALLWTYSFKRNYLVDDSFSHSIGYVGKINQRELRAFYNVKGYDNNSTIGKLGIEQTYDSYIRGKEGLIKYRVDSRERKIDSGSIIGYMIPGNSIVLNINKDIQMLAKKTLGERYGSVVVLKPATGRVLALYNYPYYSMNDVYNKYSKEDYSFLNRAIQSVYPPASIFKLVMTTALLEERVIDQDRKIYCLGYFRVGNRIFHCWHRSGHGYVNLEQAIAHSCNVYFYILGLKYLGIEKIFKYAKEYGFGEKTGIDLPNEVSGLLPSPEWKEKTFKQTWVGGDTVNFSIGQGFLSATPIQIANMIAMIANEGVVYKPRIVNRILNGNSNEVILENVPEVLRKTDIISKNTFKLLKNYMRNVITYGTARNSVLTKAVKVIGKTGTGQTGVTGLENSSFVGLAPYGGAPDEQIIIFSLVEGRSNVDNMWAAKSIDLMMQGIFSNQSYEDILKEYRPWYIR